MRGSVGRGGCMAGRGQGAGGTAAAAGGLSPFLLPDEMDDDSGDDQKQDKTNQDGRQIFSEKGQHGQSSFPGLDTDFGFQGTTLLIGTGQQEDHESDNGQGRGRADHIALPGEKHA